MEQNQIIFKFRKMFKKIEYLAELLKEVDDISTELMNSGVYRYGSFDNLSCILRAADGLVCSTKFNIQSYMSAVDKDKIDSDALMVNKEHLRLQIEPRNIV